MPKPKGHKAGCRCPICRRGGGKRRSPKKGARRAKGKVRAGGGVMHKAYSYKNRKGKTVHVKAHIEHPKRKR